jgi:molecular chaperone HscB
MPQSFDLNRNHFELFGIAPRFGIDIDALNRAYRGIQSEVHPDRFAHLSGAEQRAAMQWATHVNGAYQTLKSPQARAKYLLALNGEVIDEHAGAGLPTAFLMEQMEWHEKVEAAREQGKPEELSVLERECEAGLQRCYAELESALDDARDLAAARLALFRLMFLDKLREEIGDALEAIATAS